MATVASPPPDRAVDPSIFTLPATSILHRLYDPSRYGALATKFRHIGPLARFDHHINTVSLHEHQERGMMYNALGLSGALVEVFGSRGGGEAGSVRYCGIVIQRPLQLLDLRGNGALRAGTIQAICAQSHALAQEWSRCFYEHPEVYGRLDGLIYPNAHNGEPAVALYERAASAIPTAPKWDFELRDPAHRYTVLPALTATLLPIRLM